MHPARFSRRAVRTGGVADLPCTAAARLVPLAVALLAGARQRRFGRRSQGGAGR